MYNLLYLNGCIYAILFNSYLKIKTCGRSTKTCWLWLVQSSLVQAKPKLILYLVLELSLNLT